MCYAILRNFLVEDSSRTRTSSIGKFFELKLPIHLGIEIERVTGSLIL